MNFPIFTLLFILTAISIQLSSQGLTDSIEFLIQTTRRSKVDLLKLRDQYQKIMEDYTDRGINWVTVKKPNTVSNIIYNLNKNINDGKFKITAGGDVKNDATNHFLRTRKSK